MPLKIDKLIASEISLNGTELTPGGGNGDLITTSVKLTPVQVKSLYSTPTILVPKQGIDTGIEVISASLYLNFNSIPYTSVTQDIIIYDSDISNSQLTIKQNSLVGPGDKSLTFTKSNPGYIGNDNDLKIGCKVDNPGNGDSTVTIYLTYKVIKYV